MKNYLKLFSVSLTVTLFASCSNNELPSEESFQTSTAEQKGDLRVSFDPLENEETGTRALRNENFGQLTFEEGDVVNVYNESLRYYDYYTFQTDGFYYDAEMSGDAIPWVDNPKFAVLRGATDQNIKGYIDRATRETRVDIEIPHTLVFNASSRVANFDGKGGVGYACNLPMFGYADYSTEGDYIEISNLRYLTGVMKISLTGIGTAKYLKLSNTAGKPLSGVLTAQLYTSPDQRKNTKLEVLDEDLTVYPDLYIDLRNIPSGTSFVYIPIVAGLNGNTDGISLEYSTDTAHDSAIEAIGWLPVNGISFTGKTFVQHKRYTI